MKKLLFTALLLSAISCFAGNGQCRLCEVNRENNKNATPPPLYYEDYLKNGGAATPAATPAPATTPAKPTPTATPVKPAS